MFRPERMSDTSIICVKQDVESVLQALSSFGEFHIEQATEEASLTDYSQNIQKAEESLTNVNELIKQLLQEKTGLMDIFKETQPTKTQVTAENWQALLESTSPQVLTLKKEVDEINTSLSSLQEKTAQLNHLKDMLTTMEKMNADLAAMEELKLIHVAAANVPHKNFDGLKTALADFPLVLHRSYLSKETDFVSLAVPGKQGADVEKILKLHHAESFAIPKDLPHDVAQALKEVNNQLKENMNKEKAFSDSLNKLSKENKNKLVSWKESTENILALLNAKEKILQSGRLATVKGFVPEKKFPALNEKIHAMLGEKALVLPNGASSESRPAYKT